MKQLREPRIVVITPARNEAQVMEATLSSMADQTLKPVRWILVDDGSTDGTAEVAEGWWGRMPFLEVVRRDDRGHRAVGPGVVDAFYAGLETLDEPWDFLCKLDADLRFHPRYLEILMERFREDPKLGSASGKVILEEDGKRTEEFVIDEMSVGAFKCWRRECWETIGGLVREVMWDGIDCHTARLAGWRTRSFREDELALIHLRRTGSTEQGIWRGRLRWGRGQWFMGTGPVYLLASGVFRMREKPYLIGGLGIIFGYLGAALRRERRYDAPGFRKGLRAWQRRRLWRLITRGAVR